MLLRKAKKLGVSAGKHRYDIPLHKDSGARFLIGLIALMTLLMGMIMTTTMAIDTMTTAWVAGLGNTATIEIPAVDNEGKNLSRDEINVLATQAKDAVMTVPGTQSAEIMDDKTLSAMISPWMGEGILENSAMPLPVLLTVRLNEQADFSQTIRALKDVVAPISSIIRVDTHESWMEDLNRMVGGVKALTLFFTGLSIVATIVIILMALRMRLSLHKKDIDLLHLMGASNRYIARQFQRHSMVLTFKGAAIGSACVIAILIVCALSFADSDSTYGRTLFDFDSSVYVVLIAIPFVLALIATIVTEQTVLRHLEKMP